MANIMEKIQSKLASKQDKMLEKFLSEHVKTDELTEYEIYCNYSKLLSEELHQRKTALRYLCMADKIAKSSAVLSKKFFEITGKSIDQYSEELKNGGKQ